MQGDEILLHPTQHVNELLLVQHLKIMPLIDHVNAKLGVLRLEVGAVRLLLDQALLLADLLHAFLCDGENKG